MSSVISVQVPVIAMMMIAFITVRSSLVPLIEGLCAQPETDLESWVNEMISEQFEPEVFT